MTADDLMAPYRALEEHLPQRTRRVLETLLALHRACASLRLSFDAIAAAAGVPRGTTVDAIEKLADLGIITIHGRRSPSVNLQASKRINGTFLSRYVAAAQHALRKLSKPLFRAGH